MAKRTYGQDCALAHAVDVIGERWTLLLVRDLLVAPRRFGELQKSMQGMGSNLLADRLRELESQGLLARSELERGGHGYFLTERGLALEPAVLELIRWGLKHDIAQGSHEHHRDDWDLLALKALYDPVRAGGLTLRVQIDAGDGPGWFKIEQGRAMIGLGELDDADLVLRCTLRELFFGNTSVEKLLLRGSKSQLRQFKRLFEHEPGQE